MPDWLAFTSKSNGVANVLKTGCKVCVAYDPASPPNPVPTPLDFSAIWDTGATNSVVTMDVVNACGLKPIGIAQSHGAHGVKTVDVYLVNILLPNSVLAYSIRVGLGDLPSGSHVLIGMDIISQGDFAVTNFQGLTWFSFRCPSQAHIDYVEVHAQKTAKKTQKKKHGKKR